MRKALILITAVILVTGMFFTLSYLRVPLGDPKLRIEFYSSPPWQMRARGSLDVTVGVANDGWLLAWAKNVRVTVTMPEGFTNSRTGTNVCELNFFTLHGGDGLGNGLTIMVSNSISPGNYTITVTVSGENVQETIFTPKAIVVT